jgi:acetyl esterase/lipase
MMTRSFLKYYIFAFLTVLGFISYSQTLQNTIAIWPDSIGPGSSNLNITQTIINRTLTGTCTIDRAMEKITIPTLIPFIPHQPNGTAVILCPGGAYQRVVIDVEGSDIAKWLNSMGITAFVLTYRLPIDSHLNKESVPLQDAQRAIRYVKYHAATWSLDSSKIGILGASAGGHLASTLATHFDKQVYDPLDIIDQIGSRPSFEILLYPVISMDPAITHNGSKTNLLGSAPSQILTDEYSSEKQIKAKTPPTFIAVAKDDASVPPANSQRFHDSLLAHHISSEIHLYENGGHGKGICKAIGTDFGNWAGDCEIWLQKRLLVNSLKKKKRF